MLEIKVQEKFAAIALPYPWVADNLPEVTLIGPDLWATRRLPFALGNFWRDTVGSIRADELAESKLFIVSTTSSGESSTLDVEPSNLEARVYHAYWGVLLTGFMRCGKPLRFRGGKLPNGTVEVVSIGDVEHPHHTLGTPIPNTAFSADRLLLAGRVADGLGAIVQHQPPRLRINRVLHAFFAGINEVDAANRLHQFVRCIEGFILPARSATERQFKSRTELFVGPRYHSDFEEIYRIRSSVEHLHGPFKDIVRATERARRLGLFERAIQAEDVARYCIRNFLLNSSIWPHFNDDSSAEAFWTLPAHERQTIWGNVINFAAVKQIFDPDYVNDDDLGL
jgi:hypothetical protein